MPEARAPKVYYQPYLILSISDRLISSCRLWGHWAGVMHSSHVLMMNLVDSSVQGCPYSECGDQSRHDNQHNDDDDRIDNTENGVRIHFMCQMLILGMNCECIKDHCVTTVARNDAYIKSTVS